MNTQERNRPNEQNRNRKDQPRNIPQNDDRMENQDEFLENEENLRRAQDDTPNAMDDDNKEIQRKWKDVREDFMLRYDNLNEADVTHGDEPGEFDRMLDRIQEKTGRDKEQLRNEINQLDTDSRD